MAIAALITWLVTAGGGFVMLGMWISRGGHRPGSGSRLAPGLVFGHFALAAIGLVLWIVYVIVDSDALAWVAFVLLLPVALLGFTMLARWIPARRSGTAESRFPIPVVAAHGLFAATTLVLALLAALEVGGS
jgi:energy-converting hydrogenase Eha subunit A